MRPSASPFRTVFVIGWLLICWSGWIVPAHAVSATDDSAAQRNLIYGAGFHPPPYRSSDMAHAQSAFDIMHQGNNSNCDFIALRNGIQAIGGNGDESYWTARRLVAQDARDYHEVFYTLLGPNGSDSPFSINNLGAAPEAFMGVYQSLGYDAVLLSAAAGSPNRDFAVALRDRLLINPATSFAHLWITPRSYDPAARTISVAETGERVPLLYPYHEVAAVIDPAAPDEVIILDGLVGYPYRLALDTLASYLRGFNSVIIVSRSSTDLAEHQRFELRQRDQAYVADRLGGAYLTAARSLFGAAYTQWGAASEQPLRMTDAVGTKVVLPGEYVHYERIGDGPVTLALLGTRMGRDLEQAGMLPAGTVQFAADKQMVNGIKVWVETVFGSTTRFEQVFGAVLTDEFWLTPTAMHQVVLRDLAHPQVDAAASDGYVCVLTERAMIAWHPQFGTFLVPLGRIYTEQLRRDLGL